MSADFDSTEVAVLGGGPAGCAAAIVLARAGVDVTLLERERVPAHKVCGEFLSGESLGYLQQLGLDLHELGAVPLTTVRLAGSKMMAECRLPFAAFSLTRRCLDNHLLALAKHAGVRVLRGSQVEGLERAKNGWSTTHTSSRTLAARSVFLATGKHNLRGHPREPGSQPDLVAFKMYFRLSAREHRAMGNAVELVTYRGGYAGLQPVEDNRANLCCVVRKETLRRVGGTWPLLRNYLVAQSAHLHQRLDGAESLLEKPLTIAPIPYGFVRRCSTGLWYLGDQAAVIPSFTGDGMSLALHSGLLAAQHYLQGNVADTYQQAFATQVGRQVALATGVSKAMVQVPRGATLLPALWPGVLGLLARQTRIRPNCLLHAEVVNGFS